jgi:hypothetical protein
MPEKLVPYTQMPIAILKPVKMSGFQVMRNKLAANYSECLNIGLVRHSNGHFVFRSGMVTRQQPF